jgi:HEAT repeat protein
MADLPALLRERFTNTTDVATRREILQTLASLRDSTDADLVVAVLSDPKQNEAILPDAISAASGISSIYLTDALIGLSKASVSTNLLLQTLEALGNKGATDAIPAIAPHLRSSNWLVRETALAALIKCGGHPTINAVLVLLNDPSSDTRRAAVRVLCSFRHPRILEPLLKAYDDPATRVEAIPGLANVPDCRALDAYLEGLASPNVVVRGKCRKAIVQIQKEALPSVEGKASNLSFVTLRELQIIYENNSQAKQGPLFGAAR